MNEQNDVWVFNGANSRFPSGVFSQREKAEAWIAENRLTGVLTKYPLDVGVYEWAIRSGFFQPKKPKHKSSQFIQGFSSAHQEHYHYEDGTGDTS